MKQLKMIETMTIIIPPEVGNTLGLMFEGSPLGTPPIYVVTLTCCACCGGGATAVTNV